MRIGRTQITTAAAGRFVAATAVAFALMGTTTAFAAPVRLWVDPGHGGKDPGAVSGGLREKDSNIQISKMVVQSAKRQGWVVGQSRTTDRFVNLNERPRRANGFKADAFVSIHSNSAGSKPTGNMTIYRGGASKRLGNNIMSQLAPLTKYEDIGNHADSRGLAVLRGAKVPAVIVELLSVSNGQERAQLKSPAAQRDMAEAVIRGIAKNEGVKYVPPTKPAAAKAAAKPAAAPATKPAPAPATKPAAAKPVAKAAASPTPAPKAASSRKAVPAAKTSAKAAPATPKKAPVADRDPFGLSALLHLIFG